MLVDIQQDITEIETKRHDFLQRTGLEGRNNLSLGHGLAAVIVAIAAEKECDFIAVNLQFDDFYPGILVDRSELSEHLNSVYESWEDFSKFLSVSINKIAKYTTDLPMYTEYSKLIPDELLKRAWDADTPVKEYKV
jgi:hypothetical protein